MILKPLTSRAPPNGISKLIEPSAFPLTITTPDLNGNIVLPVESQVALTQLTIRTDPTPASSPQGFTVVRGLEILEYDGLAQRAPGVLPGASKQINIPYTQADLTQVGGDHGRVVLGRWNGTGWLIVPTTRDTGQLIASVLTASVEGWGLFIQDAVVGELPIAGFNVQSVPGNPLGAQFVNLSVGADSYAWAFGDGQTSTAFEPVHVYGSGGTYRVQLIATNTTGSSTVELDVVVNGTGGGSGAGAGLAIAAAGGLAALLLLSNRGKG